MTKKKQTQAKANKNVSPDWLVSGVLTKLGDTFDRLTGRGWNPSSSLATSKLIDKLKFLLDSEVRDLGKNGKFVPHVIKLKIQWDKFSTDSVDSLDKLKYELQIAAVDHINDRLYHTYAPLDIEIRTDYFTDGLRMLASFGKYADKDDDEVSLNVTLPNMSADDLVSDGKIKVDLNEKKPSPKEAIFIARYIANNKSVELELNFARTKRISIGRSSGSEIVIDDGSVSKIHAALVVNDDQQLMVADTGSTNGTFINGSRIAYGKAIMFDDDAKLMIGIVEIQFERIQSMTKEFPATVINEKNSATKASLEFEQRNSSSEIKKTEASIKVNEFNSHETNLNSQFNDNNVPEPTKAELERTPNNQRLTGNDFNEQSDDENDNDSQVINLDKTQDWEV